MFKVILQLLPWPLRRKILIKKFGYKIHPTAHIGLSYIYPKYLEMGEGASIGHFNVAIHLDRLVIGENSSIGRSNWITGFPTGTDSRFFSHDESRKSELIMGKESAITNKISYMDIVCTKGDFVTIAGYSSQFLTHSIDIYESRQDSHPIEIGDYCFVSTGVRVLGGAKLPAYSVLGAGAVLNKAYTKERMIYVGVPAVPKKEIPQGAKYFVREKGFVY